MSKIKDFFASLKDNRKAQAYLASTLLPMGIMLVVWLFMGVFPFGSKSLMAVDFGQQYIGLYAFFKDTVLSGDWSGLFYSFSKSIGGAMIGIWGFNIISPFNLIYVLTPLGEFKWAIFLTIWLRYGATGLAFSHLLIKRYKALNYRLYLIPLMATAYALSGMIVSYQMNPIFYDAMIMLPLVIVALEELMDGGKPFKFSLLLAASLLLHFYMGYMICLFVALYTLFYASKHLDGKEKLKSKFLAFVKSIGRVVIWGILGVGMSMVLLYPIFLNLLRSKGAYDNSMIFAWDFQINPLDILSKLVIGAFDNTSWPAGPNLPNIFVGALALVGFFLYFGLKSVSVSRRNSAAIITFIFFISFAHEFTNKIWHMGQTPAGFFYRFSWIVSFFIVLLSYQALREEKKLSKQTLVASALVLLGAAVYVGSQTYSYIEPGQPEALTTLLTSHRELVFVAILALGLAGGFILSKRLGLTKGQTGLTLGLHLLVAVGVVNLMLGGHLLGQFSMTLVAYLFVLAYLYLKPQGKQVAGLILALTSLEMGYNAYLSQVRIGYDDAYKFSDATVSIKEITDYIKETDPDEFYRVAATFIYAKNDPFLLDYNGLSNFTSNMEKSTIDLFASMGDVGGNASTFYANGTPLTDTLYGVKYFIDRKDYTNEDVQNNPTKRYFQRNSTRTDLTKYYSPVFETDRYILYKKNTPISIAFGTNDVTASIKFGTNNPVSNQNIILSSMSGNTMDYFARYAFQNVELTNMKKLETGDANQQIYERIDKTQQGTVRFKTVPQSGNTYYVTAPYGLRKSMGVVEILLNNNWYFYSQSFDQMQLWNITTETAGQELTIDFRTSKEDQIDLTGFGLVRADNAAIEQVVADRLTQSMTISDWGNTFIKGSVNITDNSSLMLTTVPYNPGWTVKVDGQVVETKEVWGSLLSFPISSGQHEIEMTFLPDGLWVGLAISLVSLGLVIGLKVYDYKRDNNYYRI